MKTHPTKQVKPTVLDNAGLYHKVKKGIPKVLGGIATVLSPFAAGSILKGLRTGLAKYPSYLPKGWNKGGSKEAFKQLKRTKNTFTNTPNQYLNPSKETINYLKKYSKDFGPIFKEMGKK